MTKFQMKMDSKIGSLFLVGSETALHGIFWEAQNVPFVDGAPKAAKTFLKQAAAEVTEYLKGKRKHFDIALAPEGTAFQKRVWKELSKIPYGETRSYKDIAKALKAPGASRAVGTANGSNPLCIVVPCHRVITSRGTLGGYSGGLKIKQTLLELERP